MKPLQFSILAIIGAIVLGYLLAEGRRTMKRRIPRKRRKGGSRLGGSGGSQTGDPGIFDYPPVLLSEDDTPAEPVYMPPAGSDPAGGISVVQDSTPPVATGGSATIEISGIPLPVGNNPGAVFTIVNS